MSADRGSGVVRLRRAAGIAAIGTIGLTVADWLLLRGRAVAHDTGVLAALVGVAAIALLARLALTLAVAARGRLVDRLPEILLLGGVLTALGAGTLNWAHRLQGYMVLYEGEARPLFRGSHLEGFDAGPLADPQEMEVFVRLAEVELEPGADGTFSPASLLIVGAHDEEEARLRVDPRRAASYRNLRFHQGSFGFAPRIVIERSGEALFDETVPFLTERHGRDGVSFGGTFTVARADLAVRGTVSLDGLDEALRGHPTLELEVERSGEPLGRGPLRPGHFAELEDGFRIGFAGLRYWSEIDVSRRTYSGPLRAGGWIALAGLASWPFVALRRRR